MLLTHPGAGLGQDGTYLACRGHAPSAAQRNQSRQCGLFGRRRLVPHLAKVGDLAADQILDHQIDVPLVDPPGRCAAIEHLKAQQLQIVGLARRHLDQTARHPEIIGQDPIYGPGDEARGIFAGQGRQRLQRRTPKEAGILAHKGVLPGGTAGHHQRQPFIPIPPLTEDRDQVAQQIALGVHEAVQVIEQQNRRAIAQSGADRRPELFKQAACIRVKVLPLGWRNLERYVRAHLLADGIGDRPEQPIQPAGGLPLQIIAELDTDADELLGQECRHLPQQRGLAHALRTGHHNDAATFEQGLPDGGDQIPAAKEQFRIVYGLAWLVGIGNV